MSGRCVRLAALLFRSCSYISPSCSQRRRHTSLSCLEAFSWPIGFPKPGRPGPCVLWVAVYAVRLFEWFRFVVLCVAGVVLAFSARRDYFRLQRCASLPFWPCSWSCSLLFLAPHGSCILHFNSALACDNAMILVSMQVLGTPVFCVLRSLRGVGLRSLWAYIVSSLSSASWVWCPTSSRSTSSIAVLGCLLRRPILHPEAFLKHTSAND